MHLYFLRTVAVEILRYSLEVRSYPKNSYYVVDERYELNVRHVAEGLRCVAGTTEYNPISSFATLTHAVRLAVFTSTSTHLTGGRPTYLPPSLGHHPVSPLLHLSSSHLATCPDKLYFSILFFSPLTNFVDL